MQSILIWFYFLLSLHYIYLTTTATSSDATNTQ